MIPGWSTRPRRSASRLKSRVESGSIIQDRRTLTAKIVPATPGSETFESLLTEPSSKVNERPTLVAL